MKVVADENIPLVEHYFGSVGELLLKPGRLITRDDLFDADILLTRSVTRVDKLLLHDTPVKFVGSTTAGADHFDTEWLNQAGIEWSIAYGCNATAVAEYVACIIAALQKEGFLQSSSLRAGVVGVGHVGHEVAEKLKALGFDLVLCDPWRGINEPLFPHVSIENFTDLDFISLHTPLIHQGRFPTYHLIEKTFLSRQKINCILLNAGRGEVVSFEDLKKYGTHLHWCLDVWENEPNIDIDVLKRALLATPHIAGYSIQAKIRGIEMIYQAAISKNIIPSFPIPPVEMQFYELTEAFSDWKDFVLKIYDPRKTSSLMKKTLLKFPDRFDYLRKHFPERYEFAFVKLSGALLK